ncbi:MAG: hypothetical protein WC530_07050, partial [Candidatus Omnitrophota bacterium]
MNAHGEGAFDTYHKSVAPFFSSTVLHLILWVNGTALVIIKTFVGKPVQETVSAPEHGIHPPEKLLFFSPKVFRRILRISQRGLFWLRGREK